MPPNERPRADTPAAGKIDVLISLNATTMAMLDDLAQAESQRSGANAKRLRSVIIRELIVEKHRQWKPAD